MMWLHFRPCLVPSWCGTSRTIWDRCWSWALQVLPVCCSHDPPQRKRAWKWMNVISGTTHCWKQNHASMAIRLEHEVSCRSKPGTRWSIRKRTDITFAVCCVSEDEQTGADLEKQGDSCLRWGKYRRNCPLDRPLRMTVLLTLLHRGFPPEITFHQHVTFTTVANSYVLFKLWDVNEAGAWRRG